ncbi:MAG TPA: 2-oxoacid:ferredoxin oxidoreductase subunit beta [Myxococcales bacterium LLY-WYZ-16_1]|jgi:2-oxoglutarate/2-oxoacid ferredoxin oxidoreductase subunit beta|nr:2-oxoacid:ferredoxin oxidoreductase subunit beta [Myxococcales bacterium LLY-WYZ-16_1]
MTETASATLTRKDFQTDQEVRWCPGCGDYAILASVQKMMPKLGIPKENIVVVSGIGCSSRFPYYMNTYGFHTIHGRAPAVATGVSLANPDLSVWVVTGDGDGLSIGGNHLIHALRRNVNLKILLFNNRIYGLTKGQYSPTSEHGKRTKSTPMGSVDEPFNPVAVALGANASFVARAYDRDPKNLEAVLQRAAAHTGAAFVEIYQNCNVFNDGAFDHFTEKAVRSERQLWLEDGKPMRFGADGQWGLRFDPNTFQPQVVRVDEVGEDALMVHDERNRGVLAACLAQLEPPRGPTVLGVFRDLERPTYESEVRAQIGAARKQRRRTLSDLLRSGDTWEVS